VRCRGVHGLANPAFLSHFSFSALPCVALYCVPGDVSLRALSLPMRTRASWLTKGGQTRWGVRTVRYRGLGVSLRQTAARGRLVRIDRGRQR
jgi:hypothetical protein